MNSSFLKDNIATTPSRWLKCTPVKRQEPEFHHELPERSRIPETCL